MVPAGTAFKKPGLHAHTGAWAMAYGLWSPVVIVDPQTPTTGGHNALVMHEVAHCKYRHKLQQLACLCVPVLGWLLFPLLAARHEVVADACALNVFGKKEFTAFLHLHREPTTWWGQWKYGSTRDIRLNRALSACSLEG